MIINLSRYDFYFNCRLNLHGMFFGSVYFFLLATWCVYCSRVLQIYVMTHDDCVSKFVANRTKYLFVLLATVKESSKVEHTCQTSHTNLHLSQF